MERRSRFLRVAAARTNRIIDTLRLLGNCSNKANYEYFDSDVTAIFKAIEDALKQSRAKFSEDTKKRKFILK